MKMNKMLMMSKMMEKILITVHNVKKKSKLVVKIVKNISWVNLIAVHKNLSKM